jgi:metal transporter CNNM
MRASTAQSARLFSTLTLLARRLVAAAPAVAVTVVDDGPDQPIGSAEFWAKLGLSAVLVLLGGVFAGLTLGLMGLDELHLRVLSASSEDPKERSNAAKGRTLICQGEAGD